LERDEGEYAYAGQLILKNVAPYCLAYNMKLPGTYLAYAGLMAVFGQTIAGVHLGLLAVNLATIALIFFFTRDLFDPLSAALAAAAYAIMSSSPSVLGMAAHATHFVAVFGVAGAWVLWRALRQNKPWLFSAAGALLGIAFLMKQQGVFLPAFGGLTTLIFYARQRPRSWRRLLAICSIYAAAAVLPYAAVCLWLWLAGTFGNFWFWTVTYARTYVGQVPLGVAWQYFWFNLQYVVGQNWPLWALAATGALGLLTAKGASAGAIRQTCPAGSASASGATGGRSASAAPPRAFFFAFLLFSFLCVCPGLYFRQHYFIVFLPCVAILTGIGAAWLLRLIWPLPAGWLATLIPAAALLFPVWQQQDYYFRWSPETACRQIYMGNPFIESTVIADYLKKHTQPGDRIAVIGSEPQIFFYADRISATGYIYTYALMESHPFAVKMQQDMIRQIETQKPEYIVLVNVSLSWLARPDSNFDILKWAGQYTAANYYPVGLIDVLSPDQTVWGSQALGAKPRSPFHLWVFRRKP
jgi:4-amino-4-deoxy-L-arabinose transferase-like glycosyltransferase